MTSQKVSISQPDIEKINTGHIVLDSSEKSINLFDQIATRLPIKWREFGNKLGLKSYVINAIDIDNSTCYDKAYQCMITKYESSTENLESDWEYWKSVLKELGEEGEYAVNDIEKEFPFLIQSSTVAKQVDHLSIEGDGGCGLFMHDAGKKGNYEIIYIDHHVEIPINIGAGHKKIIKWNKLSNLVRMQETYFHDYPILKKIAIYDLTQTAVNKQCTTLWSLHQWLNLNNDNGFSIKGYDVAQHFQLFNTGFMDNQSNSEFCITSYSEKQNSILHIEIATDSILKSLENNIQKVKQFRSLHKGIINKGIVHIPVVLYDPFVHASEIEKICKECVESKLVASLRTFEDSDKIKKWWDSVNKVIEGMKYDLEETTSTEGVSQNLLLSIISFMALAEFNLPTYACFPKTQSHELTKLIMVSPEQQAIRYSNFKRIIIKGCYGSGKSVATQLRIKFLLNTLKPNELIYHICHDPNSSFIEEMKTFANDLGNEKLIVCSSYDLVNNDNKLSSILKVLLKRYPKNILHLVVEEFNGESINDSEVEQLKSLLGNLTDSNIVLVAQAMESRRFKILAESINVFNSYKYERLKNEAQFEICYLSHSIRLSEYIYALERVAILKLQQVKIQSKIPKVKQLMSGDTQINYNVPKIVNYSPVILPYSSLNESPIENTDEGNEEEEEKITTLFPVLSDNYTIPKMLQEHLQVKVPEITETLTFTADTSSPSSEISKEIHESNELSEDVTTFDDNTLTYNKMADKDVILKYCTQNYTKENVFEIESKFKYVGERKIAHNVKGILPKIYYPFSKQKGEYTFCYKKQIYCLTLMLKKIIEVEEKYVILCFNKESFDYLYDALNNSSQIKWTTDQTKWTSNTPCFSKEKYQLLITYYTSIRGCEFPNVILVYPTNESHLKQHLVGCLNRCLTNLKIIVLNKFEENDSTMIEILEEWEDQGLLDSYELNVAKEKFYLKGSIKPILLSSQEDFLRFEMKKNTNVLKFDLEDHEIIKQLRSDFDEEHHYGQKPSDVKIKDKEDGSNKGKNTGKEKIDDDDSKAD